MANQLISTELVRLVCKQPPARTTDYRDPKIPGFALRARPSGVHSWRVQLANRRWLSLGRLDEVTLGDARVEAQRRRAAAALGHAIPKRRATSDVTLRAFLADSYEPWMKATYRGQAGQVTRIRWAFAGRHVCPPRSNWRIAWYAFPAFAPGPRVPWWTIGSLGRPTACCRRVVSPCGSCT